MARLRRGERDHLADQIHSLVGRHEYGLRESEIAEMASIDRRRLNNYLRELKSAGKVYKEGRSWYAE